MNEQQFINVLLEKGIALSNQQIEQFNQYYQLLIDWNKKMN